MSKTVLNLGITIPKTTMEKLEIHRGDVSRSRYILRLLEKSFNESKSVERESLQPNLSTDVVRSSAIDGIDYSLRKSVSDTANGSR